MHHTDRITKLRTALWHLRNGGIVQLRAHLAKARNDQSSPNTLITIGAKGQLSIAPWEIPSAPKRRKDLTVAVILDDFSEVCWRFEWRQVLLDPKRWKDQLETEAPKLLFVESAWNGNKGKWQYHLTGSNAPSAQIKHLVDACKKRGIPTVFWNKEDPVHFNDFLEVARLFDYVFTSDASKIPDYEEALNHTQVSELTFAAQSAVHNPIRPKFDFHSRDIAFGGMYFTHRHDQRRDQMSIILGAAHDISSRLPTGLEIYSRFLDGSSEYQFPPPFSEHVVGSLSYSQMLSAYRLHKVFLNVNTVVDSPTMCARRIFEIIACGTPVVTTPSKAISNTFPKGGVIQVSSRQEASSVMRALVGNEYLRKKSTHIAQREIWRRHTYEHRAVKILQTVGLQSETKTPLVSIILPTNRPHLLRSAVDTALSQSYPNVEICVGTHGFTVDKAASAEMMDRAQEAGRDLSFEYLPKTHSLGQCLNILIDQSAGTIIAKMDDDDYYGPHYIIDQVHALKFSEADVVGKGAYHVFDEDSKFLMLRNKEYEHRFAPFVAGPTLVFPRTTFDSVKFPDLRKGEDSRFLEDVLGQGGRVYSTDSFNFIMHRRGIGAEDHNHTWNVGSWELLENSEIIMSGWAPDHVTI